MKIRTDLNVKTPAFKIDNDAKIQISADACIKFKMIRDTEDAVMMKPKPFEIELNSRQREHLRVSLVAKKSFRTSDIKIRDLYFFNARLSITSGNTSNVPVMAINGALGLQVSNEQYRSLRRKLKI